MVGAGTYGQVISATNKETGAKVAIKKLSHCEDVVSTNFLRIFELNLEVSYQIFGLCNSCSTNDRPLSR